MAVCPNCDGMGKKIVEMGAGTGLFTCPSCNGTGDVESPLDGMHVCTACDGLGFTIGAGSYKDGFLSKKEQCRICNGVGLV